MCFMFAEWKTVSLVSVKSQSSSSLSKIFLHEHYIEYYNNKNYVATYVALNHVIVKRVV